MSILWDDDSGDISVTFDHQHAEAIRDIRWALDRKNYDEARALLDRSFDDNGEPK